MRKIHIAVVAFFAFGSAAYAMGGGSNHPMPTEANLKGVPAHAATRYQAGANNFTANIGTVSPRVGGWGPGKAWGDFAGSLNANGG